MNPVIGLSLGRVALGTAALLKPELLGSRMGEQPAPPLLTQAFGSREVALGAATLLTWGRARRTMILVGIAVDGADAATAYAGLQAGTVSRELGRGLAGLAGAAVLSGLAGLRDGKPAATAGA